MIKFLPLLSLAVVLSLPVVAQSKTSQPVQKIKVIIDGKEYIVADGDTLKANSQSIIIQTSEYMTFDFGSVQFDYPKHFAFEAEAGFGYRNWTLDGHSFVITYFQIDAPLSLDAFIEEVVKKFGKKNCSLRDTKTTLAGKEHSGKRINITMLGQHLTYDVYKLDIPGFNTQFLSFQDSKNEDGSDSAEGIETMKIIVSTIKVK